MKIVVVAGARPNFMKVAPIIEALRAAQQRGSDVSYKLVHTGQHYDQEMSTAFFDELGLPYPDVDLGVGSSSHAEQTAKVLVAFERLLIEEPPDLVVVVGDVNSTMACALAARKLNIPVAHVEAGLRSGDWTMPEETNRIVTDVLCDMLFTTEPAADANLLKEGVDPARIHFVGNVMIDTLLRHRGRALELRYWEQFGLRPREYAVLTLHRPSNVDNRKVFSGIVQALCEISRELPIVFPIHPRTAKMAREFDLMSSLQAQPGIHVIQPLPYLQMLSATSNARLILTDGGGLQEEAVVLGVPCITLRENTERPITIESGANRLAGSCPDAIVRAVRDVLHHTTRVLFQPAKWDGRAAERIVDIILREFSRRASSTHT